MPDAPSPTAEQQHLPDADSGVGQVPAPGQQSQSQTGRGSGASVVGVVLRRVRDGAVVLFLVLTVIFTLAHVVGDPALVFAPIDATDEEVEQVRRNFGLDRPFAERYVDYFGDVLTGDFGESNWQRRPAFDAVREALPATIQLTLAGIAIAAAFGSVAGVIAGARPGGLFDKVSNFWSIVALSVPNFWLGLLLIVVFAVNFGWLPTSGRLEMSSIVLPAVTLGIVHGGRVFQLVRSATVEEVTKPYVTVAKSKGLSAAAVLWRHVLRNSGLTMITIVGWEYVRMWGGAAFAIEYVFAWPGVGQLMINAAHRQDFFVLQAAVIVAGVFVIITNLAVDLVYRVIDRRVSGG